MIGACSLIGNDVPSDVFNAGNPFRIIKSIEESKNLVGQTQNYECAWLKIFSDKLQQSCPFICQEEDNLAEKAFADHVYLRLADHQHSWLEEEPLR